MKIFLSIVLVLSACTALQAHDQRSVDSLHTILKHPLPDSVRANAYYMLARQYWDSDPDKGLDYANQCFVLSERCGYKRGMGDACYVRACITGDRGKNIESLEWHKKALRYRKEGNSPDGDISKSLYNLGISYNNIGDFEQALAYDFECLKRYEQNNDSSQAAGLYHNIAVIYAAAGNRKFAVEHIWKAVRINKASKNTYWLAINYSVLGDYYFDDNNYQESLEYYTESAKLYSALGGPKEYYYILNMIGKCLTYTHEYPRAVDSLQKALRYFRTIKDKNGVAWSYNHLGLSYTIQGKFKDAAVCLDSCLRLCRELDPSAMRNVYQRLYELDSASGNLARAYTHYRLFITLRDSLNSTESIRAVAKQQLRAEYSLKEERDKAEQERKDARQDVVRNSILAGLIGSVVFLFVVYRQRNRITSANAKNEELLLNILPHEVAEELKAKGMADAKHFDNVTVLFTDFKSFTTISEALTPQELVGELHTCFKAFDEICTKYSIEKIKTIGDAYLAVCGLPLADKQHAENVVNAALEIREFMANRSKELGAKTFEIRIGINSGSVVAGIVGVKKFAYDIWGDTVNTAARMEQNSEAGKINISETTYTLVKDRFTCEYRGEIDAKNKGKLTMYFVEKKL
ncbi:MAG: adenylate/guanylate cyclase domain-containing protein [Candidatus Kapaibacterium sp.]